MKRTDLDIIIRQTPVSVAVFMMRKYYLKVPNEINLRDLLVYQPEAECFAHINSKGTRLYSVPADCVRFYGYLTPKEAMAESLSQNG